MKKFLLSLAVLFAGVASAQTFYMEGDESVTEIKTGVQYLLGSDSEGGRYLVNDGFNYLTEEIPTESSLVEFEFAYKEGAVSFYYVKFSQTGEYLADQVMWDYTDSSDMKQDGGGWNPAPYLYVTKDTKEAAKFSVCKAETCFKDTVVADGSHVANWRVYTGEGIGSDSTKTVYPGAWVIMRDRLSDPNPNASDSKGGANPVYLETQGVYAFYAGWGENSWHIAIPVVMNEDDVLNTWVDIHYPDGLDAMADKVGTNAGQITPESFKALEDAWAMFESYEDEDLDPAAVLAALQAADAAIATVPVTEGYYYITSVRTNDAKLPYVVYDKDGDIWGQNGFEIPLTEGTEEADVTLATSKYLWHFKSVADKESTFVIQNFGSGKYASISEWNTGLKTAETGAEYVFECLEDQYGLIYIYNKNAAGEEACTWNLFQKAHGDFVGNWKGRDDEGCHWVLTPVATEKVEAIADEVAQAELNYLLSSVYTEASVAYNGLRVAKPSVEGTGDFADHGFVALSEDSTSVNLTTNAPEPLEGSLLYVVDNDKSSFFHTAWSVGAPKPHNVVLDLGEAKDLEGLTVKFLTRNAELSWNARLAPIEIKVYATNDNLEDQNVTPNWVAQGAINVDYSYNYIHAASDTVVADTMKNVVGLGATLLDDAYRYIRFDFINNMRLSNEAGYQEFYAFSEFGVWNATEDTEAVTLLSEVPAAVKEALVAELAKARVELKAGLATKAQIDALTAAYEEFIKNVPEPTRLTDAIAAAKAIAEALPVHDVEVGFYPEAALDAYNEVIAQVEATVAPVMNLEAINQGLDALAAAKAELLKTLNMPANGYYTVRLDATDHAEALLYAHTDAVDTKEKKGLKTRFSKGTETEGAYTDDINYGKSVSTIWSLEAGENNTVAVRSISTGLYLQKNLKAGSHIQLSTDKVFLELQVDGLANDGSYNIIVGVDSVSGNTLYASFANVNATTGDLVSSETATGLNAATIRIEEVDFEDYGYGLNHFVIGYSQTKFMTFLYDAYCFVQEAKVYEAVGFLPGEGETGTIYFKQLPLDEPLVEAGQGYLVRTNSKSNYVTLEFEDDVTPESFAYSYEAKGKNGLNGTIFTTPVGAKFGTIISVNGKIGSTQNTTNAAGEVVEATVPALSGYINGNELTMLTEAPAGEDIISIETAVGLEGLNAIEGVEIVETAKSGVYTLSGVRLNSAKNLPAGIYIINGKKVVK